MFLVGWKVFTQDRQTPFFTFLSARGLKVAKPIVPTSLKYSVNIAPSQSRSRVKYFLRLIYYSTFTSSTRLRLPRSKQRRGYFLCLCALTDFLLNSRSLIFSWGEKSPKSSIWHLRNCFLQFCLFSRSPNNCAQKKKKMPYVHPGLLATWIILAHVLFPNHSFSPGQVTLSFFEENTPPRGSWLAERAFFCEEKG